MDTKQKKNLQKIKNAQKTIKDTHKIKKMHKKKIILQLFIHTK